MSNPTVSIGNSIPGPGDPSVERTTYTRIVYEAQRFFVYAEGEYDSSFTTFDPTDKGQRFYMVVPMDDTLGALRPSFVSEAAWGNELEAWEGGLRAAPSAWVTAVHSVMPKIIVSSLVLVDNGILSDSEVFAAFYLAEGGGIEDLFNWSMEDVNGDPVGATEFYKYGSIGAYAGSQYCTFKAKNDVDFQNILTLKLQEPVPAPPELDDVEALPYVVSGVFQFLLNVVPHRPAAADPAKVHTQDWSLKITFGEVEMVMSDAGSMKVRIGGEGEGDEDGNWSTVNLSDGKAKDGAVQQQHIDDKSPYLITVYPVWNGIVIASGVQEGRASPSKANPVFASSYYVPKLKKASVLEEPWSDGFDPAAPDEVEVGVESGGDDSVIVDFGEEMNITAENCRFDIAYIPCYFSREAWFTEFFVTSDDIGGIQSFTYDIYPIWTKNGTDSDLTPAPAVKESDTVGPISDTHYSYIEWGLSQEKFNRFGAEIFGSILRIIETREFPVKNGNGAFTLSWSGGTPGDPFPGGWQDYIQSASVSVSVDGSSGSITVDKYGPAGQAAVANQSIGAITIFASGAEGTVDGTIFRGLAMGVSESKSSDGASWTIPLIGLEKKLEDIALINVPFFDGEPLGVALAFLSDYAGISRNTGAANTGITLSASQDINVARFDWKSGTNIKTAIDEVMEDTLHWYVVRDGVIYYYALGANGLPLSLGGDWSGSYPDAKLVMEDLSPDFEDLRNEILVLGLEAIPSGQGSIIDQLPNFLRAAKRTTVTTPDVPWAKSIVRPMPGFITQATLETQADRLQAITSTYEIVVPTTIPGNANIKPYDRWGSFVIYSITHNLDFNSKTWTTDLEFSRAT
jgi:hypothetical protein